MTQDTPVPFTEGQYPIPTIWRETIIQIVEAFKDKDFSRINTIPNVEFIDLEFASELADNIDDYGTHLISLPEESWNSSVCYYSEGDEYLFWDAIIDLHTIEEGRSDLILNLRIRKIQEQFMFGIMGIYVP